MACGSLKYRTQKLPKNRQKFAICAPLHNFVGLYPQACIASEIDHEHCNYAAAKFSAYNCKQVLFELTNASAIGKKLVKQQ